MTAHVSPGPLDSIRLDDPAFYADPWEGYATLRREAPVFWYEPAACWVLSKYEDVQRLCSDDEAFSTAAGATLGPQFGALKQVPGGGDMADRTRRLLIARDEISRRSSATPEAEHLLRVDPPRHGQFRSVVKSQFTPRAVGAWEPWVRELVTEVFDGLSGDEVIDLVERVSMPIPLFVVAELLGVDPRDRHLFKLWTDTVMRFNDGLGDATEPEIAELGAALDGMYAYFRDRLESVGSGPNDALLSRLLGGEIEGEPLSMPSMQTLCRVILVGGNETTRHLISGAALALAEHPEQRALLAAQPELLKSAVEEFLRWVTPARHVCRTAKIRTEIRGQVIEPGEYVMALMASANRDEDVWEDADVFDVTRPTTPRHMSFTYGTHMCLGQHFPRLEARVVFEELLRRFPDYEIAGEPMRGRLLVLNGIESLPVRLVPA